MRSRPPGCTGEAAANLDMEMLPLATSRLSAHCPVAKGNLNSLFVIVLSLQGSVLQRIFRHWENDSMLQGLN